jgi:hypothetical protein
MFTKVARKILQHAIRLILGVLANHSLFANSECSRGVNSAKD